MPTSKRSSAKGAKPASAPAKEAPSAPRLPKWFSEELVVPYRAGIASVFLVHGDTTCLVPNQDGDREPESGFINFRTFLEKMFDERAMVVFYNIASGLEFLTPEMEEEFKRLAGVSSDSASAPADPIEAAKASLQAKRGLPREPEACLPLLEKALRTIESTAVIVHSAHFLASTTGGAAAVLSPAERANIERFRNWAQDETIRAKNNIVLLLTDQAAKVSNELRNSNIGIPQVFIPKPDREERQAFLQSVLDDRNGYVDIVVQQTVTTADLSALVVATQGMSLRQILEVFLRARAEGNPVDLAYVKLKKREILTAEYGDLLEIIDPERGLDDIGGLEHIKRYFIEILDLLKKGEKDLVPMGVTLMGPPGTGKTAIVEALAKGAGFNFVKTKNIRSMWVGESEARMELLVHALRSLAPVIVMNDEADLAEANRDSPKGDSGVSQRIMQQWMTFLSDPRIRGQVLVINCTNRPDRLDAAMKRSGRSDDRLLLPMPGADERTAIFPVMFTRHRIPTVLKDFRPFEKDTDGLSGADLENIVRNSERFRRRMKKAAVDDEALRFAIRDFIPSASQADIDFMTLVALLESSSRVLLPKNVTEMVKEIERRNLVPRGADMIARLRERRIA